MNAEKLWKYSDIGMGLKLTCGFPFASQYFSSNHGFPLIRIRDILQSKIETYYDGIIPPGYLIRKDDILIGMDGDFHVVKWKNEDALLNQRVLKVDVQNNTQLSLDFVYFWLQPYVKKINDLTAATTVKHLSTKDIFKAKGYLPSRKVQQKIATILTSIDTAIEKTEALIEKYQQIKSGLMHDLFTRGVLPNGQLRPTREQAPELYQETKIGWIPKEWVVLSCQEIFDIDSGITLGAHRRPNKNPRPYLRVANVFKEKISMHDIAYLEASNDENQRYGLKTFDLLLVEGHANVQQIGRCAIVENNAEGILFQNHLFRLRAKEVLPYFGLYILNSHIARRYWETNCSTSSGLNTINRKMLGSMKLCVPPIDEQRLLIDKAVSLNNLIDKERCCLSKLQHQKLGLMQDLLTGKVPVTVSENADQEEAHA